MFIRNVGLHLKHVFVTLGTYCECICDVFRVSTDHFYIVIVHSWRFRLLYCTRIYQFWTIKKIWGKKNNDRNCLGLQIMYSLYFVCYFLGQWETVGKIKSKNCVLDVSNRESYFLFSLFDCLSTIKWCNNVSCIITCFLIYLFMNAGLVYFALYEYPCTMKYTQISVGMVQESRM